MDPDTLNMVDGPDRRKAQSMVLNVVRSYSYDKPGMYNMADVDAFRSKLNTGDWHCSVHTRDLKTGEGSDICGKRRTDGLKEQVIIEVSPTHLTFIHTIRRPGEGGTSELGFFPMMPGLSGVPMFAMMNPEAFADMQVGLGELPMIMEDGPHAFGLDSSEMQDKLKVLKLHPPLNPEQMEKLNKRMKDFEKDFDKSKGLQAPAAPVEPATPQALPAPQPMQ